MNSRKSEEEMLPESVAAVPVAEALDAWDAGAIEDGSVSHGEVTLVIAPATIRRVCGWLKREHGFARLSNVTAVDRHPAEPRFEAVYHLHSITGNQRLRLKGLLGGDSPAIDSLISVWRCADWYEREVFDLFGIDFKGHPNLKRLLLPESWEGHPLRKDFPVHGHKYSYGEQS